MTTNLHARHFLKLLDFTQKEIEHLLELAAELKWAKASGTEEAKLKRPQRVPDVHSKWPLLTREHTSLTWGHQDRKSARRNR